MCVMDPKESRKEIKQGSDEFDMDFLFPDQSVITLNASRFMITEGYFNPESITIRSMGLPKLIKEAIQSWERSQIAPLVENILIFGGSAAIDGLIERLEAEIRPLFSSALNVKVTYFGNIPFLPWVGASAMVSKNKIKKWNTLENNIINGGGS